MSIEIPERCADCQDGIVISKCCGRGLCFNCWQNHGQEHSLNENARRCWKDEKSFSEFERKEQERKMARLKSGYFLIETTEDGMNVKCFKNGEVLAESLAEEFQDTGTNKKFDERFPGNSFYSQGSQYWDTENEAGRIIIKGEIIAPRAKKVVETYEID